jgi:hypothetical protein
MARLRHFGRHQGGPDTWGQMAKINAAATDNFGLSVSVSGDTAIVGAFLDDDAGTASGSAYVFRINLDLSYLEFLPHPDLGGVAPSCCVRARRFLASPLRYGRFYDNNRRLYSRQGI